MEGEDGMFSRTIADLAGCEPGPRAQAERVPQGRRPGRSSSDSGGVTAPASPPPRTTRSASPGCGVTLAVSDNRGLEKNKNRIDRTSRELPIGLEEHSERESAEREEVERAEREGGGGQGNRIPPASSIEPEIPGRSETNRTPFDFSEGVSELVSATGLAISPALHLVISDINYSANGEVTIPTILFHGRRNRHPTTGSHEPAKLRLRYWSGLHPINRRGHSHPNSSKKQQSSKKVVLLIWLWCCVFLRHFSY
ncbi:Protein of unknown function [Gryllus bimaculatus]|nr:Protein of unknown function [Gryllus bimaculatus]